MTITKLKQVETIANKYFKCAVRPITDISAKGYKGVKLIVGMKRNPSYDPSINPEDRANLPIELKQDNNLLENKTNPETPDIRILWLPPGISEEELVDGWLLKIQASLKAKKPIIRKDPTLTKLEVESDADIAAKMALGKNVDSRFEEWDDGYDDSLDEEPQEVRGASVIEDKISSTEDKILSDRLKAGSNVEYAKEEPENNNNEILEAIGQIGENMTVLSNDINSLSDNFGKLEERVNNIEKKPRGKGKKGPEVKAK